MERGAGGAASPPRGIMAGEVSGRGNRRRRGAFPGPDVGTARTRCDWNPVREGNVEGEARRGRVSPACGTILTAEPLLGVEGGGRDGTGACEGR